MLNWLAGLEFRLLPFDLTVVALAVLGLVCAIFADRMGRPAMLAIYRSAGHAALEAAKESPVLFWIPLVSLRHWQSFRKSEDQLRDWMDRVGWLRRRPGDA